MFDIWTICGIRRIRIASHRCVSADGDAELACYWILCCIRHILLVWDRHGRVRVPPIGRHDGISDHIAYNWNSSCLAQLCFHSPGRWLRVRPHPLPHRFRQLFRRWTGTRILSHFHHVPSIFEPAAVWAFSRIVRIAVGMIAMRNICTHIHRRCSPANHRTVKSERNQYEIRIVVKQNNYERWTYRQFRAVRVQCLNFDDGSQSRPTLWQASPTRFIQFLDIHVGHGFDGRRNNSFRSFSTFSSINWNKNTKSGDFDGEQ